MNSDPKHTALSSLTATYTDSEAEDEYDVSTIQLEESYDRQKIVEANVSSKDPTLVSYNDEHAASDEDDSPRNSGISSAESSDDLPPEPKGRCAPELQKRVNELYEKKKKGFDMNKHIQQRKTFRNPSIYEKLIEYCNLNEYGTNYPPHIYDPFRWNKESYYDELAKVQKSEMDKREKEKKEKTKVEIVSGTAKHLTSTSNSKILGKPDFGSTITESNTNSSAASGKSISSSDGEKRRRTKWDQVPQGGGMLSSTITTAGVTTAIGGPKLLTTINIQTVTTTASGTKTTVIPAFGTLPKKQKL